MSRTMKMTWTAMLVAITTLTSHLFYIPLGFTKVFPMQHFINVISAVLLGPSYAVMQAFSVSLIRNMMGTGSIFAFPGSMIGAFFAAFLYKKFHHIFLAFIGETIGTGIIGAIVSYPIAVLFLGKEVALFGFIPSFFASSFVGSIFGILTLRIMIKNSAFQSYLHHKLMQK